MFCVQGDMSEGQFSISKQCHLAELLHDLTIAEEYAYGRSDWDVGDAENIGSIGTQLLRYWNYQCRHLSFKLASDYYISFIYFYFYLFINKTLFRMWLWNWYCFLHVFLEHFVQWSRTYFCRYICAVVKEASPVLLRGWWWMKQEWSQDVGGISALCSHRCLDTVGWVAGRNLSHKKPVLYTAESFHPE